MVRAVTLPAQDFVLVHGAWHGGWCWSEVVNALESAGHRAFAPTLSGLGAGAEDLTRATGLADHVADIEGLLRDEDLRDVVLVLHSYGGMIGRVLEGRCAARLAGVVYIEAVVPEDGEALLDLIPALARDNFLSAARERGEGWRIPPPDPAQFAIRDRNTIDYLSRRLTDQPLKAFTDKVTLEASGFAGPKLYLYASDRQPQPYQIFVDRFFDDDAWCVTALTGGHEMMLTNPDGLVETLLQFSMDVKGKEEAMRLERDVEYDEKVGAYFGKTRPMAQEDMLGRVFRFNELPHSDIAFIDAVVPGHSRILMGALGGGTSDENLSSQVEQAENYHIDFIRANPGNGAALHSHDSEETFVCLTGRWKVFWGDQGEESVELGYLDGICCPSGVMRAFENISDNEALMMSILGGKEPGHVVWADSIRGKLAAAKE
ncbi:alpha/beta fold hydrolase [Pelagibius sp. Alg239-R121]|uniref:alpha/beta fold hydrolase n=1 Tax=Pelagibius sp. Alg239-R121 TaxID=2993448 RepID=UPI0024A6F6DD|nr:alpha/beta fold hydrolase [Pelagibius sp. Alg239-R121]